MIDSAGNAPSITCEFFGADPDLVASVSCGLIDQICAQVDVDAVLLAAIEVPVLDVVEALAHRGAVASVTVAVEPDRILVVHFDALVPDGVSLDELLGEHTELVTSFFDVDVDPLSGRVQLRGDLQ